MDYEQIEKIINEIIDMLSYNENVLEYNKDIQEKINEKIKRIADITDTFDFQIMKETKNINEELTIIDTETSKKVKLINIDSMKDRVKDITSCNDMFSCLKTLALSNKICHIFDKDVESVNINKQGRLNNLFLKYYNIIYPSSTLSLITFNEIKPYNANIEDKYNIDFIKQNIDFDKLYKALSEKYEKIKKGTKISILNTFKIKYDIKDDNDINDKFKSIYDDKENITKLYLENIYKYGIKIKKIQDLCFSIKDIYISMVGQLLVKNTFTNVPYELVKTGKEGFEYMLIIDDKELSYYIEVHMPNYIAKSLINDYGMTLNTIRELDGQGLGASAVYKRDKSEVKRIKELLESCFPFKNILRPKVITRDYGDVEESAIKIEYTFLTKRIEDKDSLIEEFIEKYKKYNLNYIKLSKYNESLSYEQTKKINNYKLNSIYDEFNYEDKIDFIAYSIHKLKNGDLFDYNMYTKTHNIINIDNIDKIGKLFVNFDIFKNDFIKENEYLISKYNDNDNIQLKTITNEYINNYIDNYFNNMFDKTKGI